MTEIPANKPPTPRPAEVEPHDPRVESLAVLLARDYVEKNCLKRTDDTFEPAWRGINDEKAMIGKSPADLVAEGWTIEAATAAVIDLANAPYNHYSEYWKQRNRGGAQFLIDMADTRGADVLLSLDLEDPGVRSEYGSLIHDNWIDGNEWVKALEGGNPDLAWPFHELSPGEQQKDIDQLVVLQAWLAEQPT